MIIGGKTRTDGKELGEYLGDYLQADKNDRVEMIELTGSAYRGLTKSIASWEAEAKGSKCQQPLWHAHLRTPAHEHLTREQQIEAANILERHLGFATYDKDGKLLHRQPRAIVIHENAGHEHVHVVWSRIRRHDEEVETRRRTGNRDKTKEVDDRPYKVTTHTMKAGTAKATSHSKKKNCAAAREIEERFGLQVVDSPNFKKDGTREERREDSASKLNYRDYQKAKRNGLDITEMRNTITRIWQESDSGKALRAGMQEAGYILAMGDKRTHVFVDPAGEIHSLPRFIKGALKKDVVERLKDVDPASIPRATHVQQQRYYAWKERRPAPERKADDAPRKKTNEPDVARESTKTPSRKKRDNPFEEPEHDPLDPATILKAITRTRATFTESDLRYEVGKRLGENSDPAASINLTKQVTELPDFLRLGEDHNGRQRFSSVDTVETEKALATAAEVLAGRFSHEIKRDRLDHAPSSKKLTEEQRAVTEYIIAPGALKLVEGIAGGGKSTTMKPVNETAIAAGYRTRGLAVAGIAAQGLQDSTGIQSGTIMSFLMAAEKLPEDKARLAAMDDQLVRGGRDYFIRKQERDQLARRIDMATLGKRDIVFIDEAGMVGTRQMGKLLDMAAQAEAKVVLIGDSEQLQAIDGGAPYRFLTERHGAARISEVWRQKEAWQKQATRDFRDGETAIALQTYRDKGHVHKIEADEDARERVLADWSKSRQQNPTHTHLMLAFTNDDVDTLNERARDSYRKEGKLGPEDKVATEDGPRNFAQGDRLYFLKNSKVLQVMNGTLGTVEKLQQIDGTADHRITVKLDKGGRLVEFSTKDYNDITHGYAATIHKTQGATADRAIVLASKYMDRHATYVSMSRHVHQADMYYSGADFADFDQLEKKLSREARKDMALDYIAHSKEKKVLQPAPESAPVDAPKPTTAPTRAELIKRAAERMADELDLSVNPARSEERKERRAAAVQAARLRRVLGERPDKLRDIGPEV